MTRRSLDERLVSAGVGPGVEPVAAWHLLRDREGPHATVIDYDESWPPRYERWRDAVASRLGETALRIEHVGSTSVPGLLAKPIIDLQVSVADLSDEPAYVPPLGDAGLQLRSRDDLHRYFRPFPGQPREVHVHVCTIGSDWEQEHLLFRDYLRTHPEAREDYARVKTAAAERWADDGIAYTDAKTDVILAILARARAGAAHLGRLDVTEP